MKPSDLETHTIPDAVAERMRIANGSAAARRKLNDLDIDGTSVDDMTGYMRFFFRSERHIDAMREDPETGEQQPAVIPIDGFILDPGNDWALVNWFVKGLPPAERVGPPN
jgi:hypothetical protein